MNNNTNFNSIYNIFYILSNKYKSVINTNNQIFKTLKKLNIINQHNIVNTQLYIGIFENILISNFLFFNKNFKKIIFLLNKLLKRYSSIYFFKTSNNYINNFLEEIIKSKNFKYKNLFKFIYHSYNSKRLKKIKFVKRIIRLPNFPGAFIIFDLKYNKYLLKNLIKRFKIPIIFILENLNRKFLLNQYYNYFCIINLNNFKLCIIFINLLIKNLILTI